jgi:hypothetical protein
MLQKFNPQLVEHLGNLSRIMAQENEFMGMQVAAKLRRCVHVSEHEISLDLKQFLRYNVAIQSRIIKAILPEKRSALHIENLRDFITSPLSTEMSISRNWRVEKTGTKMILRKQ